MKKFLSLVLFFVFFSSVSDAQFNMDPSGFSTDFFSDRFDRKPAVVSAYGGDIFIGGDFRYYGGTVELNGGAIYRNGQIIPWGNLGTNSRIQNIAVTEDNVVVTGRLFLDGSDQYHELAVWDGSGFLPVSTSIDVDGDPIEFRVSTSVAQIISSGSKVYIQASITSGPQNYMRNILLEWDGTELSKIAFLWSYSDTHIYSISSGSFDRINDSIYVKLWPSFGKIGSDLPELSECRLARISPDLVECLSSAARKYIVWDDDWAYYTEQEGKVHIFDLDHNLIYTLDSGIQINSGGLQYVNGKTVWISLDENNDLILNTYSIGNHQELRIANFGQGIRFIPRSSGRWSAIGFGNVFDGGEFGIIYIDPLSNFWQIEGGSAARMNNLSRQPESVPAGLGYARYIGKAGNDYLFIINRQVYRWNGNRLRPMGRQMIATSKWTSDLNPVNLRSKHYKGKLILYGNIFAFTDGTPVYGMVYWDGNDWQPAFRHKIRESYGLTSVTEFKGNLYATTYGFTDASSKLLRLNPSGRSFWDLSEWARIDAYHEKYNYQGIIDIATQGDNLYISTASGLIVYDGNSFERASIPEKESYRAGKFAKRNGTLYFIVRDFNTSSMDVYYLDGKEIKFYASLNEWPNVNVQNLNVLNNTLVTSAQNSIIFINYHQSNKVDLMISNSPTLRAEDDKLFISGDFLTLGGNVPAANSAMFMASSIRNNGNDIANLQPNYPNPFNHQTNIRFELQERSFVSLNVYSIDGRRVATLTTNVYDQGVYTFTWDATGLASGVYIARLKTNRGGKTDKMLLIK